MFEKKYELKKICKDDSFECLNYPQKNFVKQLFRLFLANQSTIEETVNQLNKLMENKIEYKKYGVMPNVYYNERN